MDRLGRELEDILEENRDHTLISSIPISLELSILVRCDRNKFRDI